MDDPEFLVKGKAGGLARIRPESPREQEAPVDALAEEVPHLLDYLNVVLKRRWVVLSCLLIVFSTVAMVTLKQKPVYKGTVLIEINPEQPHVLNFSEVLQINSTDVESFRETQYNILQSRTLADRVVTSLKLYQKPEFYRARVLFGLLERNPENIPSPSDPNPPGPTSDAYRNSVTRFMGSVDVSPVRGSNLVELSFFSQDPKLASRAANQLASDYIDQNLQVKWDETIKASEWLSSQLVGLKAKLEKSEDELQAYAQANSIVFVEERQNLVNERLKQLQEEYTKAQARRYEKESLFNLVKAGQVQDLPGFLSNQLIQNLAMRVAELQRDYAELTARVKPDYPRAVALKKQIDTVQESLDRQKTALAQNIVEEYQSAAANEQYLAQAIEQQKAEVNRIGEKSIQYNILKREADTSRQLYNALLQRLKESQVSAGLRASNIRVVDAAEIPKSPVKPRVIVNLALGMILGLGLGVGLAFFQEYLDNTLKTPDEVETFLRLPSLGVLPAFAANGAGKSSDQKQGIAIHGERLPAAPAIQTEPAAQEAFRSLRTSILLSANPVPRTILITSALPGEGKTTITINLGATLASLGNKTVIVDCDMRRPSCHRSAGVQNSPGFVRCLTGQVDLPQAIVPVPGVPSLSVIPCGPIPPNPAEVLSSPVTSELLRRLREMFDYVLVDSPPLLSVADSRILATFTDAVVLVARAFSTPYDATRRARELLYGANARILGVALNDVDFRRGEYTYKSYYRYAYGDYGYVSSQPSDAEEAMDSEADR
jgi:succinoglycan biosynthesis transport protein ExoP